MCVYIYICIYICIYVYMYIHICICRCASRSSADSRAPLLSAHAAALCSDQMRFQFPLTGVPRSQEPPPP